MESTEWQVLRISSPHKEKLCSIQRRDGMVAGENYQPKGMNQLGVWKRLQILSNLPALFKSFRAHKQEIAGYDLTWLSTSWEKSLPPKVMNKVRSERVRGEEKCEFKFKVRGIEWRETVFKHTGIILDFSIGSVLVNTFTNSPTLRRSKERWNWMAKGLVKMQDYVVHLFMCSFIHDIV